MKNQANYHENIFAAFAAAKKDLLIRLIEGIKQKHQARSIGLITKDDFNRKITAFLILKCVLLIEIVKDTFEWGNCTLLSPVLRTWFSSVFVFMTAHYTCLVILAFHPFVLPTVHYIELIALTIFIISKIAGYLSHPKYIYS